MSKTYELKIQFGKTGEAISTIVADSYESAISIAYKKYSHRKITKIEAIIPILQIKK